MHQVAGQQHRALLDLQASIRRMFDQGRQAGVVRQAQQGGDHHQVAVIGFRVVPVQIQELAGHLRQHRREVPFVQDPVANLWMDVLDDVVEADRVREQLVVLLGVGQDRQYADLVDQAGEGGAVGLERSEAPRQFGAHAGHFQAGSPGLAHAALHGTGAGVENLLDDQADGEGCCCSSHPVA